MIEDFPEETDFPIRLKRARMRAWRRGMREMDLILGRYIDKHGPDFDAAQMTAFEGLLAQRDQDLYDWASGRETPLATSANHDEAALMARIRSASSTFAET